MKIAITGANGFIGKHVLKKLSKTNHQINALVRENNNFKVVSENIKYTQFDYMDANVETFSNLDNPDTLIHLAWSNLDNYNSIKHMQNELEISYNFIKYMISSGLKNLLVAGTCFEYGMNEGMLSETIIANPTNNYSKAKNLLLHRIQILLNNRSFNFTWMRIFYLYGHDQNKNSIFGLLKEAVRRNQANFNMSPGDQMRDYSHVEDIAEQIKKLVMLENNNGIVNLCSGSGKKIVEIVEEWKNENKWKIDLNLGYYPYNQNEPKNFWGNKNKYLNLTKKLENEDG